MRFWQTEMILHRWIVIRFTVGKMIIFILRVDQKFTSDKYCLHYGVQKLNYERDNVLNTNIKCTHVLLINNIVTLYRWINE